MKRILLLLALGVYLGAPISARAVEAASASITLAQDEQDHVDPALGVDERPWVNLAFPALMIAGGLIYVALTRRHRNS